MPPLSVELPADPVLIRRDTNTLIFEPLTGPGNIVELLAEWRKEAPLASEDAFPTIDDIPAHPESTCIPKRS